MRGSLVMQSKYKLLVHTTTFIIDQTDSMSRSKVGMGE